MAFRAEDGGETVPHRPPDSRSIPTPARRFRTQRRRTMTQEAAVLERTLLRDVAAALEPFRRKQRDLQAFLASQLERLELRAEQFDRREQELEIRAAELAKSRAALDEEWAHVDRLVETAETHAAELLREKQRLELLARDAPHDEIVAELEQLRERLETVEHERSVLEEELSAAKLKIGQMADAVVESAEARSEIVALRRMLAELRGDRSPEETTVETPPSTVADAPAVQKIDDVLARFEAAKREMTKRRRGKPQS